MTFESLIGKYEQQLLALNLKRNLKRLDESLHRFFRLFPEKTDPEDFSRLDVVYFTKHQAADGKPEKETAEDIKHTRAFFYFLIDYLDYNLPNPCSERDQSAWAKLRQGKLDNILESKSELGA